MKNEFIDAIHGFFHGKIYILHISSTANLHEIQTSSEKKSTQACVKLWRMSEFQSFFGKGSIVPWKKYSMFNAIHGTSATLGKFSELTGKTMLDE